LPVAELSWAGVGVGSQTELIQDEDRAGTFGGSHPASPQPDERQAAFRDDDVFHDGQAAEKPWQLIGAGKPGLGPGRAPEPLDAPAGQDNLARFRPDSAVDKVEQCGLARAVGADQPGDPARGYDEIGTVDRAQPAERLTSPRAAPRRLVLVRLARGSMVNAPIKVQVIVDEARFQALTAGHDRRARRR
jgi:hypothetical protein